MSASNALHSLYGGKAARAALAGNVGGQARVQTVFTPRWLLDGVIAAVGMPIALDPCTTPENPVGARRYISPGPAPAAGWPLGHLACDGLAESWAVWSMGCLVYVNPPYDALAAWLEKCVAEATQGARIVALVPWRSQRTWFCSAAKTAAWVATLAPFPFVGHRSAFPAPLCLIGWGVDPVTSLTLPGKRGPKEIVTACFDLREKRS